METKRGARLNTWLLKLVFSMVVAAVFFVASGFTSDAAADLVQTKEGDTSATVKWDRDTTTDYSIGYAKIKGTYPTTEEKKAAENMAESRKIVLKASQKSYTINGLKKSSQYVVVVRYSWGTYSTSYTTMYNGYVYTKLQKVTGVKQQKWWYWALSVDAKWNGQAGAKYEVVFLNKAGKAVKRYIGKDAVSGTSASMGQVKNDKIYKIRVRAIRPANEYYSTVKQYASKWSDDCYLFTQPMVTKAKVVGGKLQLTWNKVQGMTKYNVYVSTKEKSGYKKVASVKKNSATIAKLGKKKFSASKTYYVYIVGNMKVGKKTYNSGKHYTNTVKNGSISTNWTF